MRLIGFILPLFEMLLTAKRQLILFDCFVFRDKNLANMALYDAFNFILLGGLRAG